MPAKPIAASRRASAARVDGGRGAGRRAGAGLDAQQRIVFVDDEARCASIAASTYERAPRREPDFRRRRPSRTRDERAQLRRIDPAERRGKAGEAANAAQAAAAGHRHDGHLRQRPPGRPKRGSHRVVGIRDAEPFAVDTHRNALRASTHSAMSARSPDDRQRPAAIDQAAELGGPGLSGKARPERQRQRAHLRSGERTDHDIARRSRPRAGRGGRAPRAAPAGSPRAGRGSAGWRGASGRCGRCPASPRSRRGLAAWSSVKAPHHGRTRTSRPSPLGIGRSAPGHQPLMSKGRRGSCARPRHDAVAAPQATELRRVTHRPRSSASRSRAEIAAVASRFFSSMAASTASSAISAACVASNRWPGTASAVAAKA